MDLKQKPSLYGLSLEELRKIVISHALPKYRADQLAQWLYQKHAASFEETANLSGEFREKLKEDHELFTLQLVEARESSDHESRKFLYKTRDSQLIESVLIVQKDRYTVCVSTQIGCKIGCTFCASGKGKFGRNLTAGEIVEQVAWIEKTLKKEAKEKGVTNIVFMGMGEPLDNFDATMKSLEILQAPWGFGVGARRITVSTSGITPRIEEFVKRSGGRVRLSVSLHSSDEARRTELVPINKKYSLKELKETLGRVHNTLKRDITFEYTVLAGVNDSVKEAEGVARMARPLHAKVNLIPYNPISEADYKRPSPEQVDQFRAILEKNGIQVTVRQTAGRDINAACGQLARLKTQDTGHKTQEKADHKL